MNFSARVAMEAVTVAVMVVVAVASKKKSSKLSKKRYNLIFNSFDMNQLKYP